MSIEICPCCSKSGLEGFDHITNSHGDYKLLICPSCLSIINLTAYELTLLRSQEDIQKAEHYNSCALSDVELSSEIQANTENLQNLMKISGFIAENAVFCDFGAGRGCASIAAADMFRIIYSVDLDMEQLQMTLLRLPNIQNIRVINNLNSIDTPIDFFYAWHALEHFPEPHAFICELSKHLSSESIIALQVPLFRPDYVIDCHYVFYNEASLQRLSTVWGFTVISVIIDHSLGFITLIAQNSLNPISELRN